MDGILLTFDPNYYKTIYIDETALDTTVFVMDTSNLFIKFNKKSPHNSYPASSTFTYLITGMKNPPNEGIYTPTPDLTGKVIKNTIIIDERKYTSPPSYTGLGITDCIVKTSTVSLPVPVSVPKSSS